MAKCRFGYGDQQIKRLLLSILRLVRRWQNTKIKIIMLITELMLMQKIFSQID